MGKVNLAEKFSLFAEYWSPRIVGELNDQYIKLVKFKGEFIWHSHVHEDELFLVVKGTLKIEFRDDLVTVNEGEFYIVPKGVEHKPMADEETHIILLEPKSTEQTGGIKSNLLVDEQPWI
jgi:mannose-6-phosphate isomerase-like protein (cupin superfamily)